MTVSIGKVSTIYIVELILRDMEDFLETGERKLNFISEEVNHIDNMIANWLEMFEDYPEGFQIEERNEIVQEIGETLGSMTIWEDDESDRQEIISKITSYFGEFQGFSKLVIRVYKFTHEEEWDQK